MEMGLTNNEIIWFHCHNFQDFLLLILVIINVSGRSGGVSPPSAALLLLLCGYWFAVLGRWFLTALDL